MDWLEVVFNCKGDECGNCGAWRPLVGREIVACDCGDDAYDIYETDANAEALP